MSQNIVAHPSAVRRIPTVGVDHFARAEAALTALVDRIDVTLADLRRTEQLLSAADAAMESGDIDRMAAVGNLLQARIEARRARREARQAA